MLQSSVQRATSSDASETGDRRQRCENGRGG